MLCGCVNGGIKDKSQNASKTINSNEMVSFETGFYRKADSLYDKDRDYQFKMEKQDDSTFIIYNDDLSCQTDSTFAASLNQILLDNDLIQYNGTNKKTSGLPDEFKPYWIHAKYASNETLDFSMDGDPYAKWTFDVLNLFAREFSKQGIDDFLPTKENTTITRFELKYCFDDTRYVYSEIFVSDDEKMVYEEAWDKEGKNRVHDRIKAPITEEHYRNLEKLVEETNLLSFENNRERPSDFDYSKAYYEFYIEYESGRVVRAFSDDAKDIENIKPIIDKISAYYKDYIKEQI